MRTSVLPIRITSCHAVGTPARHLKFDCYVKNPTERPLCILDARITVHLHQGAVLAEGRFFLHKRALNGDAAIKSKEEALGEISLPLSDAVLYHIEGTRAGHDVLLKFSSEVLAFHVPDQSGSGSFEVPAPFQFGHGSHGPFEHTIALSDWVKLLRAMGWSELELLEIPSAKLKSLPTLARTFQLFEEARDCLRRGDWDGTMADCRKAVEAMLKDTIGSNDLSRAGEALEKLVPDRAKAAALNAALKGITAFLQLGRHEFVPAVTIKPADARLALRWTGAFLTFLGEQ